MRDNYDVLGLPRGLNREDYFAKYCELKSIYSEDRFLVGEAGNEAARKLTELESAWIHISSELEKEKINNDFGSDFGQIDMLLRDGRYDEAQSLLDSLMRRDAEWHYFQSIIFYKREWMIECRKHLVIALNMEPNNDKYRQTLEKLDLKMANSAVPPEQFGNYQQPHEEKLCNNNNLANCCIAYFCLDCCCTLARCC